MAEGGTCRIRDVRCGGWGRGVGAGNEISRVPLSPWNPKSNENHPLWNALEKTVWALPRSCSHLPFFYAYIYVHVCMWEAQDRCHADTQNAPNPEPEIPEPAAPQKRTLLTQKKKRRNPETDPQTRTPCARTARSLSRPGSSLGIFRT